MTLFDQLILLATGLVAAYLVWRFADHYRTTSTSCDIYYILSFTVLLVAGLLLIVFTYDALDNPLVVIVSALIPAGLAVGSVYEVYPKYGRSYLILTVLGLVALAVTRLTGPEGLATAVLASVHTLFGLTIFLLPISAVYRKEAPTRFLWVTVGGVLIGIGGIALAFLKTGNQLLFFTVDLVFAILAPLLLLMVLAFAWGFVKMLKAPPAELAA
jgi:hypothetical protein